MKHTFVFHSISLAKKIQKSVGFKSLPLDLSYSEACALLVIASSQEINQKEIASKLHLEPASIVSLIDELGKNGLVSRESPNGDRRKYRIVLTKLGKIKVKHIKNKTYKLDNLLRKQLTPKEEASFESILKKLNAYLAEWKGGENEIPGTKRYLAS
ncbi:hypothetical protein A3F02_02005 [Candidatus Curtissbacteria bacterium RIFCSPHIGHO2_12_FULL_38_9b]|uniref:HTH marR-type domain-containing protein n=2 Tax=Candidatus Curtissiibacteriota TaxID=1752717 RepID=A0A1F5GXP3_9BACT|nr:MAG: hypothetical protein A3A48_00375 [Candidatus Curtissbacteria bacterium RIFCSPLOWO2_01_FULL_37_9]OGD96653.1 MAG: hypothetical protein A3F02_02005 [Candidatus Curtissbacteria bacterium RIFCSPHIGHO2_12_FULL_38_9b]